MTGREKKAFHDGWVGGQRCAYRHAFEKLRNEHSFLIKRINDIHDIEDEARKNELIRRAQTIRNIARFIHVYASAYRKEE